MSASARTGPPGSTGPAGPAGPAGPSADISGEAAARQAADATLTDAAAAAQATANAALPKAGGTMTGKIVLDGDPTASLHPATRQYVLAQIAALINGAPGALDTLKEIADQLSTDEGAVAALTSTVAGKLAAASNLADLVNAATARTNLGLGSAATHPAGDFDSSGAAAAAQAASQPLDSDLTAIAALTTTAFGRGLLAQADAAALLTAIGAASSSGLTAEAAARVSGDAAAVPKSLVDAKGDLFVATADDSPDRLAVGANGTVLTADSAQTKGVKWATTAGGFGTPTIGKIKSGRYYAAAGQWGTQTVTRSNLYFIPFWVPEAAVLDRIGYTIGAGVASCVVRLGIYSDDGHGYPGALLGDYGTIDASSGGAKEITVSITFTGPTLVWLAAAAQGGASDPTGRVLNGIGPVNLGSLSAIDETSGTIAGYVQSAVAGALPANASAGLTGNYTVAAPFVRGA